MAKRNPIGLLAVAALTAAITASPAIASAQTVSSEQALQAAFNSARPGTVITLANGTYTLSTSLETQANGTALSPIIVKSQNLHGATIVSNGFDKGIHIQH